MKQLLFPLSIGLLALLVLASLLLGGPYSSIDPAILARFAIPPRWCPPRAC